MEARGFGECQASQGIAVKIKVRITCESRGRAGACMTGEGSRYSLKKRKRTCYTLDGSKKRKRNSLRSQRRHRREDTRRTLVAASKRETAAL